MKVLLLGGTGAIGNHLQQFLNDMNINTYITSRKIRNSTNAIKYIQGNAHDIEFIKSIVEEQWDVIVDFMNYSTFEFKKNISYLLKATKQYIFLSSGRVFANSDQLITEESERLLDVSDDNDYLNTDEYSLAKAKQEDCLINSNYTNWTIVRPYITYSENRLQLGVLEKEEWLYRAINGRTVIFSKEMMQKNTTLTYGLDVARMIMKLIGNSNVLGKVYNVTTSEFLTWSKVVNIYFDLIKKNTGLEPKILLKDYDVFYNIKPAKYQIKYDRFYDRKFDNSKILSHFNTDFFIKVKDGINDCLNNFLKEPLYKSINWKSEALKDKMTNEHTPLNEITGVKQKIKYVVYRYIIKYKI